MSSSAVRPRYGDALPTAARRRVEALRAMVRAMQFVPMTDAELADRERRFRQAAANNAIEGIFLDAEDQAVFRVLDEERVPEKLRIELLHEYLRLRHALPG